MKGRKDWTRLSEASARALARMPSDDLLMSLAADRWREVVGEYLAGQLIPVGLRSGCLEIRALEPRVARTLAPLAPQIERRIRREIPGVRRIVLR